MCLNIYAQTKPKFKIAKNDILVYKVLDANGGSCYRTLKISYKNRPGEELIENWTPGFIYTETQFRQKALKTTFRYCKYEVNGNALHSCKNTKQAYNHQGHNDQIVIMYIPKGAFYYENENEYASSSLYYPE